MSLLRYAVIACCLFAQAKFTLAQECKVIDLMPKFFEVVESSSDQSPQQQVSAFRKALELDRTDLYSSTGMGFQSSQRLDAAIVKALAAARQNADPMRSMSSLLRKNLPSYRAAFTKVFPDFKCNFPIYLAPSLGMLDGAGRVVDGTPSLIFGVDNIAAEFSASDAALRIFVDHELFHRYHSQVAGFSDDNGNHEIIWRALWAEGLATYVSMAMNPPSTMQDALFFPTDLVQRARPMLPSMIAQLEPKLDQVDPQFFAMFFNAGPSHGDIPPRSGYYIGALAAQQMAKQMSLQDLAHTNGSALRTRLSDALTSASRQ